MTNGKFCCWSLREATMGNKMVENGNGRNFFLKVFQFNNYNRSYHFDHTEKCILIWQPVTPLSKTWSRSQYINDRDTRTFGKRSEWANTRSDTAKTRVHSKQNFQLIIILLPRLIYIIQVWSMFGKNAVFMTRVAFIDGHHVKHSKT